MNTYTGEVTVGGEVDVRELAALSISKLAVGPYNNNVYLLRCRVTGEALLIDAADEADSIISLSGRSGDQPSSIITTHRHADHWQALGDVTGRIGARTFAGADDAEGIDVPTDVLLEHGSTVQFGEITLSVTQLRGHTPGSIALHYADPDGIGHLFTGDSLFPGGVGRTTNPADFHSLISDVSSRLFDVYDDRTWFYPGHGFDSTLGAQRAELPIWRERGW